MAVTSASTTVMSHVPIVTVILSLACAAHLCYLLPVIANVETKITTNCVRVNHVMKNFREIFSSRLRELRGCENQKNFAKTIGLKQTTYSNYESGTREPGLQIVGEVATHFGVSADWLLGLTDGPAPGVSLTATGSSVAANHSTVSTGGLDAEERSRLLGIIESQQSVIAALSGTGKGK